MQNFLPLRATTNSRLWTEHGCPAAAGFGERIITLLVIALVRQFGTRETGLNMYFGNEVLQQQGSSSPLPSGRSEMENWVLEVRRKKMKTHPSE
jgi:hypothetical protein